MTAAPLTRRISCLVLLFSLLGWSVWWAVCNMYEFAPPLSTAALICAWCAASLAILGGATRAPWLTRALAGLNGLYLLAVHRQIDAGVGPFVFGLVLVVVSCVMGWGRLKDKRPASLPAV